jgi:phosphate transport system substrate-binding protein
VQQGNVHRALVKNRSGEWVEATLDSVTASASAVRLDSPDDFRLSLLDSPTKDAYPICGAICIVIQAKVPGERKEKLLTFMTWIVHGGQEFTTALGFAQIPSGLAAQANEKLQSLRVQ